VSERGADLRELRQDRREGAYQQNCVDRREIRADGSEICGDRRDLSGDLRDRRGDIRRSARRST
jgi:hypothetical protein